MSASRAGAELGQEEEAAMEMEGKKKRPQKKAIKCFFILTKFIAKGGWEKG